MRVVEEPLTYQRLVEIRDRLLTPLNDDGLRAWYANDVSVLFREVILLRRERAEALCICQENPALDEQTDDLVAAAQRISERWAEIKRGVWAKAEVKRLQETVANHEEALSEYANTIAAKQAKIEQLCAEAAELSVRLVGAIAEAKQRVAQLQGR